MFPFEMEIHVHAPNYYNHINGAMVSVFTSSAGDREFKPRSGQTKDYNIGICCFSAKHVVLKRKNKH